MSALILVVEDEIDLRNLIDIHLKKENFRSFLTASGEEALAQIPRLNPDLIILDLMLPGISGQEICRYIRKKSELAHILILMLTAKSDENDIVQGLELGADDYLTKPFSPKVLMARVNALLRRERSSAEVISGIVKHHSITIDQGRYQVMVADKEIKLTQTEFKLLSCLINRPGWVFSRYQLVNEARGDDIIVTDRAIDVQIVGLRKKLGEAGKLIETVRGVGYKIQE